MENLQRRPNKTRRVYRHLVPFSQIMAGVHNKLHVFVVVVVVFAYSIAMKRS